MVPPPPAPSPRAPCPAAKTLAVRELLDDLPEGLAGRVRVGAPDTAPVGRLSTGIGAVDALLAGGFPRGDLAEITGTLGSGRTSLARALLAATTRSREFVAVIDAGDAFDPDAAENAGIQFTRTLWVRAPTLPTAMRCAERLLEARGFALVVLDPGDLPLARGHFEFDPASLQRLRRSAAASGTALVCVDSERRFGRFASLVLRAHDSRPHFDRNPDWFEGMQTHFALDRSRTAPVGESVSLHWKVPPLASGLSVRTGPADRRGAASSP